MKHTPLKKHSRSDPAVTKKQLHQQITDYQTFLYMHGYQPPRRLILGKETIFDITGEQELTGGYNERIWDSCYHLMTTPLTQVGVQHPDAILSNELAAGHLFGTTRDWIKKHHPKEWKHVQRILRMTEIPIIDPYLHPILPLIPPIAQELMIDIGIKAWEQDFNRPLINNKGKPLTGFGFWPPELGINNQSLDILAKKGVRFLILNQAQIDQQEFAPIYSVDTAHGEILVLAYNGWEFAQKLAFSNIDNTTAFADSINIYSSQHHFPPFAAMDMETFGEWRGEDSMWFINYLVHQQLHPDTFKRHPNMIRNAKIHEATSWSCTHGLGRWTGKNDCSCDGADAELRKRKQALYQGLWDHLDETIKNLETDSEWKPTFINFFINNRQNLAIGESIDFNTLSNLHWRHWFQRLYLGLVGMTSCGWFYAGELERQIPENSLNKLNQLAGR